MHNGNKSCFLVILHHTDGSVGWGGRCRYYRDEVRMEAEEGQVLQGGNKDGGEGGSGSTTEFRGSASATEGVI